MEHFKRSIVEAINIVYALEQEEIAREEISFIVDTACPCSCVHIVIIWNNIQFLCNPISEENFAVEQELAKAMNYFSDSDKEEFIAYLDNKHKGLQEGRNLVARVVTLIRRAHNAEKN